jgi:hypothetical protein
MEINLELELLKEYLENQTSDTLKEFVLSDSLYDFQKHLDKANIKINLFSSFSESIVKQFTTDKYLLRYGK